MPSVEGRAGFSIPFCSPFIHFKRRVNDIIHQLCYSFILTRTQYLAAESSNPFFFPFCPATLFPSQQPLSPFLKKSVRVHIRYTPRLFHKAAKLAFPSLFTGCLILEGYKLGHSFKKIHKEHSFLIGLLPNTSILFKNLRLAWPQAKCTQRSLLRFSLRALQCMLTCI